MRDINVEPNKDVNNVFPHLKKIQKAEWNEQISTPIVVSRSGILYSMLALVLIHLLTLILFVDMCKMQNSFFETPILPDTRYFLDKYFNSAHAVDYYAVCPHCQRFIGKFNRGGRFILCNHCHSNVALKSPTHNDYFALINVNNEIKQLIESHSSSYEAAKYRRMAESGKIRDFCKEKFIRKLELKE